MDEYERMYLTLYATIFSGLVVERKRKGDKYIGVQEYEEMAKDATMFAQSGLSYWWNNRGREKHREKKHEASSTADKEHIKALEEQIKDLKERIILERRVARLEGKSLDITGPEEKDEAQA